MTPEEKKELKTLLFKSNVALIVLLFIVAIIIMVNLILKI